MRDIISELAPVNGKKAVRVMALAVMDIVMINLAAFLALLLRFEFSVAAAAESGFLANILKYWWINTLGTMAVFAYLKLYKSVWQFAGVDELIRIVIASAASAMLQLAGMFLLTMSMPRSFPVMYALLLCAFTAMVRFSYRFVRRERMIYTGRKRQRLRTMLIGAGNAGAMALRELNFSEHSGNVVVCIIDDDANKKGSYLMGVEIFGGRDRIREAVTRFGVEEIIFCIPSMPNRERMELFKLCRETGCIIKTLPGLYQLANGEVSIKQIRDVQIEDLLGRDVVQVDVDEIAGYITGKTVLVTGGGGSIGSELCRQIARHDPGRLIIFDIYENNAYEIQQELKRKYPGLCLEVLIGSVRDAGRVYDIMDRFRPELVFHAAAHKHVPLMEDSPAEAVKNNVFGTMNVAKAASACGAARFVLISTDKAVNPTSIMGATKRICEMLVQMMNEQSRTEYVAVRFGNVLGSNGSVIPLFRSQIEDGGPVTVTHKDVIRYFMTIPEAVSLVLQAGAFGRGGEIFVLDMGEPVRIDDLARNMIRLSGFEPDVDIPVVYTGLRPGEKLYEEILMQEEGMKKTANDLIYIGHEIQFDEAKFEEDLMLLKSVAAGEPDKVEDLVASIVPTYHRERAGQARETAGV